MGSMKVRTSITLSESLIQAIDVRIDGYGSRSSFIEAAVTAFIGQISRAERDGRDVEIINRQADTLNAEALDALSYQVDL